MSLKKIIMPAYRHKFYFIIFCIVLAAFYKHAGAQEILNRIQNLVLIDIDQTSGLKAGDKVTVIRKEHDGRTTEVGVVEIVRYQAGRCAAKIIEEGPGFRISVGDFIQLQIRKPSEPKDGTRISDAVDDLFESVSAFYAVQRIIDGYLLIDAGPDSELKPGQIYPVKRKTSWGYEFLGAVEIIRFQEKQCAGRLVLHSGAKEVGVNDVVFADALLDARNDRTHDMPLKLRRSNTLGYGSIGAGVISAGLGYFLYSGSRKTYEKYGAAQSGAEALRLWDKTIQQRNHSRIAFGAGGGLAAFGIVYLLLRSNAPEPQTRYSIKPFEQPDVKGLKLEISLN